MDWNPIGGRLPEVDTEVLLRSKKEQYFIGEYKDNGLFRVISRYQLQQDGSILAMTTGFHQSNFTHWAEITLPATVTSVTAASQISDFPRRIRLDLMTPEELGIYNMVGEVEKLGAHPLLTDVVVLLAEARNKLADWVDLQAVQPIEPILGICTCDRCRHMRGEL